MDPIADMITRIRNANAIQRASVDVFCSTLTQAIADVLVREGWIESATRQGKKGKQEKSELALTLKYDVKGKARIAALRRVSKPGKRVYRGWRELRSVRQGYGAALVSTPKGVLTDAQARKEKVGGEVLFEIW
ncbi:MAG: 30S ribosomal protein S8 [bacterium]|nr:30S ribosomal protein S8 [bacterium]